jgi:hypothetical protein
MRHSRAYVDGICGRCAQRLKMVHRSCLCRSCYDVVLWVARGQQETAYLAAWLHTRDEERTPTVSRLRQVALKEGLDWTKAPPPALHFVQRLDGLMAPYRAKAIA